MAVSPVLGPAGVVVLDGRDLLLDPGPALLAPQQPVYRLPLELHLKVSEEKGYSVRGYSVRDTV